MKSGKNPKKFSSLLLRRRVSHSPSPCSPTGPQRGPVLMRSLSAEAGERAMTRSDWRRFEEAALSKAFDPQVAVLDPEVEQTAEPAVQQTWRPEVAVPKIQRHE